MLNPQQLRLNYTSWCCCTAIVMVESTIQWMLCTLCGLITNNMPLIDSTRCQQSTWRYQGMFKDKSKYPTLTRMSFCQCRLKLVFTSIFRQFGWKHVALLLDRSDLFSLTVGKSTLMNCWAPFVVLFNFSSQNIHIIINMLLHTIIIDRQKSGIRFKGGGFTEIRTRIERQRRRTLRGLSARCQHVRSRCAGMPELNWYWQLMRRFHSLSLWQLHPLCQPPSVARSGYTERPWIVGTEVYVGCSRDGHDKRRLDISGCGDFSGKRPFRFFQPPISSIATMIWNGEIERQQSKS